MNTLPNKTRMAEDITRRLDELIKSLKSWNLLCAIYERPASHEEDLIHAYANEAKSLVMTSLRKTFHLGTLCIDEEAHDVQEELNELNTIDSREAELATLCKKILTQYRKAAA